MAKWTVSRLLETAKYLSTKAGEELGPFILQMAEYVENTTRCLRNGLSVADNFDAELKTVALKHLIATPISAKKPVTGAFPIRAEGTNAIDSFAWYYDSSGRLTAKVGFVGAPADSVNVTLVLLF